MYEFKHAVTNTTSDVEKIKNRRKQNFEDEANNKQLDKEDTRRTNLNSKYSSVTLVIKHPDLFYLFLLCSISVLVKYDLILRSGARVKLFTLFIQKQHNKVTVRLTQYKEKNYISLEIYKKIII